MKPDFDYDLLYKADQFLSIRLLPKRPKVIKIHGSIHDRMQMAITLDEVSREINT